MRKNVFGLLMIALISLSLLVGCQTLSHDFQNDTPGRIAESFFPEFHSLPDAIQSEFEYRKTSSYEGYFLRLRFNSASEYDRFLEGIEAEYLEMTDLQRQQSSFIVDRAQFAVEDYSFCAIDMSQFGDKDASYIGLIAHCEEENTIVFLYFKSAFSGVESIYDGLGPHGYMEFYTDIWAANHRHSIDSSYGPDTVKKEEE